MGLELLSNGKTCIVPEAFLLFTREADIKRMSLAADHRVTQIPIKGVEKALAIDFHINDNRIYWADGERQVNINCSLADMTTFSYYFTVNMEGLDIETVLLSTHNIYEPLHEIYNNVVYATSKGSDQPAHTRSLIRAFASHLSIL